MVPQPQLFQLLCSLYLSRNILKILGVRFAKQIVHSFFLGSFSKIFQLWLKSSMLFNLPKKRCSHIFFVRSSGFLFSASTSIIMSFEHFQAGLPFHVRCQATTFSSCLGVLRAMTIRPFDVICIRKTLTCTLPALKLLYWSLSIPPPSRMWHPVLLMIEAPSPHLAVANAKFLVSRFCVCRLPDRSLGCGISVCPFTLTGELSCRPRMR